MKTNNIKEDYKKAIKMTLINIERNVDDIVDIAFNNSTRGFNIDIQIKPDEIVKWELQMMINSSYGDKFMSIKGDDINETKESL